MWSETFPTLLISLTPLSRYRLYTSTSTSQLNAFTASAVCVHRTLSGNVHDSRAFRGAQISPFTCFCAGSTYAFSLSIPVSLSHCYADGDCHISSVSCTKTWHSLCIHLPFTVLLSSATPSCSRQQANKQAASAYRREFDFHFGGGKKPRYDTTKIFEKRSVSQSHSFRMVRLSIFTVSRFKVNIQTYRDTLLFFWSFSTNRATKVKWRIL